MSSFKRYIAKDEEVVISKAREGNLGDKGGDEESDEENDLILNSNNEPNVLYVRFDDEKAGKTTISTSSNSFAKQNNVVPIETVLARTRVRPGKASSPEIQTIQFPIALPSACTVHKVQGLTLEKVVVSLALKKQRSFNY